MMLSTRAEEKRRGQFAARSLFWMIPLFWLLAVIETSFFPHLTLFGAIPEAVFCTVCLVAYQRGGITGGVAGLIGGTLLCALGGDAILLPLLFTLIGLALGALAERLIPRLSTFLLLVTPAQIVLCFYRAVADGAWRLFFPRLIGSVLISLALFGIVRGFSLRRRGLN